MIAHTSKAIRSPIDGVLYNGVGSIGLAGYYRRVLLNKAACF